MFTASDKAIQLPRRNHQLAHLRGRARLIFELAKKEVTDRYSGQALGAIWLVGHTLLLIAVYIFLFSVVLKVKVSSRGAGAIPLDYTSYILAGLVPWLPVLEVLNKSSSVVISHSSLVKQVVFPLEVLPAKSVVSTLFPLAISLPLLIIYVLITGGSLPWTYLLLPFLLFFQIVMMVGICYFLSAVGVFFRDVKDMIHMMTMVLAYILPIFYLPESVPAAFRPILYINPFSYLIWCYQDALYFGRFEHPWAWGIFPAVSVVVAYVGYKTFRNLKTMFGNVL